MKPSVQNSFVGGELSPQVYGRSDLTKWHNGCSTLRNFFVNFRGGAASRAGLAYVGTCKQQYPAAPPRHINFQYSVSQGFALEFGDQYMRVIFDGAYVTESAQPITGITQASPGVFSYTNSSYTLSNNDWVFVQNVGGMTNFNGLVWIVQNATSSSFTVTDLFGNPVDTSTFAAYTSGGTISRIYTATAPYAAVDLPFLKFTQSQNTMSLTCVNQQTGTEYPPYDLTRITNTNWVFTAVNFATSITPPTGLTATAQNSTTKTTYYSYLVTAVSAATGEESAASSTVTVQNNDIAINAGSNTLTWNATPGAAFYNVYAAIASYGVPVQAGVNFGYIGTAYSPNFTDTNIAPDFAQTAPTHQNPFARSTITAVNIVTPGSGFNQSSVYYNINTTTGSGFQGTPIIVNGSVVAFLVQNGGSGYAPTDTITLNDGGVAASGTIAFSANPGDASFLTFKASSSSRSTAWTFVTGVPGNNQTQIGNNLTATLINLVTNLNSSTDPVISLCSYAVSGNSITITYRQAGTVGNAFQYAGSSSSHSSPTSLTNLTGGANGANSSAAASLTVGPATGTYPGCVAYYQQRRVYANTTNNPNEYFMSRPGAFLNMDSAVPVTDSDAIIGAPWAQQVNGIQAMQPMTGGLVVLTGSGAWIVNGGSAAAITPSDQTATAQAYNGCHFHIPPIVVNYDILYVQAKGCIVRDLSYNFFVNIYTGTDITILSNHLFNYHQLQQWAYTEEPYKTVWTVRDDGILLCLTYLKEQDVYAWSRHDTNGLIVGCCSVTEPPVDALYVVTQRYINGQWMYYTERMDSRNWTTSENPFCVDAGLLYPLNYPNATLTPASATGTGNISSVEVVKGGTLYTSTPTINAIDPTGGGSGATFSATVVGGVLTSITPLTQGKGYGPNTQIIINDNSGSGAIAQPLITNDVVFNVSAPVFSAQNVGDVIRIGNNNQTTTGFSVTNNGGGKGTVVAYNSPTQVVVNLTSPITSVVPNDPNNTPIPAPSGQWSISTPITVVSGLNHLEGMSVVALADGAVVKNLTVKNGSVNLPFAASYIIIGLPYTCQLQTMYLEPPGHEPLTGKRKNIYSVSVRTENTRGISAGTNQPDQATTPGNAFTAWTGMQPTRQNIPAMKANQAAPLFTGDFYVNVPADWSVYGQVAIQQQDPLPANILSIASYFQDGDQSG